VLCSVSSIARHSGKAPGNCAGLKLEVRAVLACFKHRRPKMHIVPKIGVSYAYHLSKEKGGL